jgi:hypothetical protein
MRQRQASHRQLMAAIESYLKERPGAADSAEGVADWWLRETGLQASLGEVREALESLERKGTVTTQAMVDGRVIYLAAPKGRRQQSG